MKAERRIAARVEGQYAHRTNMLRLCDTLEPPRRRSRIEIDIPDAPWWNPMTKGIAVAVLVTASVLAVAMLAMG